MNPHEKNAVLYFKHLRSQGILPSDALEHTRLRFGVDKKTLMERINGFVADQDATRETLAEVKDYFAKGGAQDNGCCGFDGDRADELLQKLYEAITGEKAYS